MVSMYTEPEAFLDDFVEIGVQVVNPLRYPPRDRHLRTV